MLENSSAGPGHAIYYEGALIDISGAHELSFELRLRRLCRPRRAVGVRVAVEGVGGSRRRVGYLIPAALRHMDGAATAGLIMGSAVPLSEARLRSAERVYMDVHPGLARSRTAQRNVRRGAQCAPAGARCRDELPHLGGAQTTGLLLLSSVETNDRGLGSGVQNSAPLP